eukprot:6173455-Pleurochrysis_carterae.AAC.1
MCLRAWMRAYHSCASVRMCVDESKALRTCRCMVTLALEQNHKVVKGASKGLERSCGACRLRLRTDWRHARAEEHAEVLVREALGAAETWRRCRRCSRHAQAEASSIVHGKCMDSESGPALFDQCKKSCVEPLVNKKPRRAAGGFSHRHSAGMHFYRFLC